MESDRSRVVSASRALLLALSLVVAMLGHGGFAIASPQIYWIVPFSPNPPPGLTASFGDDAVEACRVWAHHNSQQPSVFQSCTLSATEIWATDPSRSTCRFVGGSACAQLFPYGEWRCIGNENRSTLSCACPAGSYFDATVGNGGLSPDSLGNCVAQCAAGADAVNGVCQRPGDNPGNNGECPDGTCKIHNPVNPAAGIKFERIPLYRGNGPLPLELALIYNSRSVTSVHPPIRLSWTGGFGNAWIADHLRAVKLPDGSLPVSAPASVSVQRQDGKILTFNRVGSTDQYTAAIPAFSDWGHQHVHLCQWESAELLGHGRTSACKPRKHFWSGRWRPLHSSGIKGAGFKFPDDATAQVLTAVSVRESPSIA